MKEDTETQGFILEKLYEVYWNKGCHADITWDDIAEQRGVDREVILDNFEVLRDNGIGHSATMGSAEITAAGVLLLEDNGAVPQENILRNRGARMQILRVLAEDRDEHGRQVMTDFEDVMKRSGIERIDFDRNDQILIEQGWMEFVAVGTLAITSLGYAQVKEWRKTLQRAERFEALKTNDSITPQKRGHEFEIILQAILEEEGWTCEKNVRGVGEEHDIVVHRDREYYLAECKWVQEKTDTGTIRNFRDKLTARVGTHGLFFSMSGYTSEAVASAEGRLESAIPLLFGPGDIEAIMSQKTTFNALLNEKFHAAISRRKLLTQ